MGNVVFESLVWLSTVRVWMYGTGVDVYLHGCTGVGCIQGLRYVFMRHIVDGAIWMLMNSYLPGHIRSGWGISCLQALYLIHRSLPTDLQFLIIVSGIQVYSRAPRIFYHLAQIRQSRTRSLTPFLLAFVGKYCTGGTCKTSGSMLWLFLGRVDVEHYMYSSSSSTTGT